MNSYSLEKFELKIHETLDRPTSYSLKSTTTTDSYKRERRKIYIIMDNEQFLYVGEANTSIKTRFHRGFTSYRFFKKNNKARGGYQGYKWISQYAQKEDQQLSVFVAIFNDSFDAEKEYIEAVEAELVFLIRKSQDAWPLFQNEIHFNNIEGAKEMAQQIFKHLR